MQGSALVSGGHFVTVAVALATVATTLPNGSYSVQARSILAVAVWWAVVAGVLLRVFPRAAVPKEGLVAGVCLAGLSLFTVLSMGWGVDDGGAFDDALRAIVYTGVFALVLVAAPARSARAWLNGLAIGLVAMSVLALGSRMVPSLFSEGDLVTALPEVRGRLSYPLGYWNALGAVLGMTTVLLMGLAGLSRTVTGRSLATAAIPLSALGVFLTSSRGGALAGAVGLVTLFALSRHRVRLVAAAVIGGTGSAVLVLAAVGRDLFTDGQVDGAGYTAEANSMLLLTLVVVAAALTLRPLVDPLVERIQVPRTVSIVAASLAVLALLVGLVGADPVERWHELKAPPDTSAKVEGSGLVTRHLTSTEGTGRYQFWKAGWQAFESDPLKGVGAAGYEPWWAQHGSLDYYVRNAHSLFVETLAELGIVGFLLLLGFLGAPIAAGVRHRIAGEERAVAGVLLAVLGCGIMAAAVEWTWEIPGAFIPVVVVTALLAGPALWPGPERRRGVRLAVGACVVVAGLAFLVAGGIALTSDAKLRASREAASDGELAKAADDARSAASIQPWAAAPRLQLALTLEGSDPAAAQRALAEAIERSPEDWRLWLALTRIRSASGDRAGALEALSRTRQLAPPTPALQDLLGTRSRQ
ncbi:MAG: O-antigen ligase family protein [Thermoleophilaceae bacterium]|nr:O-antigen ligase family protein [Thermoleophilaceae bacterium]